MSPRYIILGPVTGSGHTRYGILADDRRTVREITITRPEGVEVPVPANVRWKVEFFIGGPVRPFWFNGNAPTGQARNLMPTSADRTLAAAREKGARKLYRANEARVMRRAE